MLGRYKTILHFLPEKLMVAVVKLGQTPVIEQTAEIDWQVEGLADALAQFESQIKGEVRILLSDELSYVLELEVPTDVKEEKLRQFVAEHAKAKIPEALQAEDWDFKIFSLPEDEVGQIIVFAPVKDKFKKISQALATAKIKVEAVEPELVAKTRNEDPMLGLALKSDIKGKDEQVLNLNLAQADLPDEEQNSDVDKKSSSVSMGVLVVVGIVLGVLVSVIWLKMRT
jgi:hypothetical protein